MKLNQAIALVSGKKTKAHNILTKAHHGWKDRITGLNRSYQPKDDDGDQFPPEQRQVQLRVRDAVGEIREVLSDFYNLVATQEYANTEARADVKVGDKVIVPKVPVSMLLFLEKQLVDLRTFFGNVPTLPADQNWKFDNNKNCYVTEPSVSVKTQKVPTTHVKFEPTEHQPGQAEILNVDKTIGHWTTIHMSGAMEAKERDDIIERIEELQDAVKMAREEANSMEVTQQKMIGRQVFDFVIGGK